MGVFLEHIFSAAHRDESPPLDASEEQFGKFTLKNDGFVGFTKGDDGVWIHICLVL